MANKKSTGQAKAVRPKIPDYGEKIIVKFKDYVQLPYEEGVERYIEEYNVGAWKKLSKKYSGINIRPLFSKIKKEDVIRHTKNALESNPDYKDPHYLNYFIINCPAEVNANALLKQLKKWTNIEHAYLDQPIFSPDVDYLNDPDSGLQQYLDPFPDGIDAKYAWGFAGGDGATPGLRFVDLERDWDFTTGDLLITDPGSIIYGSRSGITADIEHGKSVLGIICSQDNTAATVGIVPNTSDVKLAAHDGTISDLHDAIVDLITTPGKLNPGDILLIEATIQLADEMGTNRYVPVEGVEAIFDAIEDATNAGIIVIEAAGDDNVNLDDFQTFDEGDTPFTTDGSGFGDSGAIMVTAGMWVGAEVKHSTDANYGSRIDCFYFGDNLQTIGGTFSGTSASTAVVAGAAIAMQSLYESAYGFKLTPSELRQYMIDTGEIFDNDSDGTADDTLIGVMPNLRNFIDTHMAKPDVYIRDNLGDTGDTSTGCLSISPDMKVTVGDYSGDADAAFNSAEVGNKVEIGLDHYVWVRAINRGGEDAVDVVATIYWSEVASLINPTGWNLINTITWNVPQGGSLYAGGPIAWPSTSLPPEGHYCLIGILDHPDDPAPPLAAFIDREDFHQFVAEENNVAWKNFNVESFDDPPPSPSPEPPEDPEIEPEPGFGSKSVDFKAAGAHNKDLIMELEINSNLPKGSKMYLEVPMKWERPLKMRTPYIRTRKRKRTILVPIKYNGKHRFKPILFKAKVKIPMKLHIKVPEKYLKRTYEVAVRQLYEGKGIGRVAWMFKPKKELDKLLELRRKNAMQMKKKK